MTKRTDGPSDAVKIRVLKRDRFRCTYCGVPGTDAELEVDHIIPVARGGSHHISNLTTACRSCNQHKGAGDAPKRPHQPKPSTSPAVFDADLLVQAEVHRIEFDLRRHSVEIHLADGDCVDMSGAIYLAKRIDPFVRRINTFSGAARDTSYGQIFDDKWEAFTPPRAVPAGDFGAVK